MTVGLMGSQLLCECIQKSLASAGDGKEQQQAALETLPAIFHTKLGALVEYPWAVSTGPDAAYVSVTSKCNVIFVFYCTYCKAESFCMACVAS